MEKQAYIFIGRSGCGKGTQVKLFIDQLKQQGRSVFNFETGSKFREFIQGKTYSSQLAKKINDGGELQPMFLALSLWSTALIENLKENEDLLLDGTPRKKDQADVLENQELTEEEIGILKDVKEKIEQGKYAEAWEEILTINK